jgi:hypothetical protein
MSKQPRKYEPGKGGKRVVAELSEPEFKEFEVVRAQVKNDTGIDTDRATIIVAIKHFAKHIERGDFEK